MNNKSANKNSWKILVIFLILMIGLILAIQTAQQNQENRSNAEENDVVPVVEDENINDNMCGEADELPALSRPVDDLCSIGLPIWIDSVASGGLYRWKCVDELSGESSECSAVLEN